MSRRPLPDATGLDEWLNKVLPSNWFKGQPEVLVDKDEILIMGRLSAPAPVPGAVTAPTVERDSDAPVPADQVESLLRRIAQFREDTRAERIRVAEAVQVRWHRKVSWGARCGEAEAVFTHLAAPVMTRLTFDQRRMLDTMVDSGVVGSRSEALAWCVDQVAEHQGAWIGRLRDAMTEVERVRAEGPPR